MSRVVEGDRRLSGRRIRAGSASGRKWHLGTESVLGLKAATGASPHPGGEGAEKSLPVVHIALTGVGPVGSIGGNKPAVTPRRNGSTHDVPTIPYVEGGQGWRVFPMHEGAESIPRCAAERNALDGLFQVPLVPARGITGT